MSELERRRISEDLALAARKFGSGEAGGTSEFKSAVLDALRSGFSVEEIGRHHLIRFIEAHSSTLSEPQIQKLEILRLLTVLQDFDLVDGSPLTYQSEVKGSLRRAVAVLQNHLQKRPDNDLTNLERSLRDSDIDDCTRNIRNWNRHNVLS